MFIDVFVYAFECIHHTLQLVGCRLQSAEGRSGTIHIYVNFMKNIYMYIYFIRHTPKSEVCVRVCVCGSVCVCVCVCVRV